MHAWNVVLETPAGRVRMTTAMYVRTSLSLERTASVTSIIGASCLHILDTHHYTTITTTIAASFLPLLF